MARKVRVEYPGDIYHVMNREDHQEVIFADDRDRIRFVETLGEACAKAQWQVPRLLSDEQSLSSVRFALVFVGALTDSAEPYGF